MPEDALLPVHASVPGKLILAGEHSAVYGRPALVVAVGARVRVALSRSNESGIRLSLPEVGFSGNESLGSILAYCARYRSLWIEYSEDPGPRSFARLRTSDPAHLVKLAVGEAATVAQWDPQVSLSLRVDSELPAGSGLGSSAAVAVGVVAAILAAAGLEPDAAGIGRLALEVERRQHGSPSGIDTEAVLRGGALWSSGSADGAPALVPLEGDLSLLDSLETFDSGRPPEPTGVVVSAVRELSSREPEIFESALSELEDGTREFRAALMADDGPGLVRAIRRLHAALVNLGVVPDPVLERVASIEEAGGAAKISGAGSLAGPGAGSLLVYHASGRSLADHDALRDLRPLDAKLGSEGLVLQVGGEKS